MLYTKGFAVGQTWTSRRGGYTVKVTGLIHALTLDGFEYIKGVRIQYPEGHERVCGPEFLTGFFNLTNL